MKLVSGRSVARYYDPRFGRFLSQDPLPDIVEQARQRAVGMYSTEALMGAAAGWTSPEFASRESKFADVVSAGWLNNKLRPFDWMREEVNPRPSTGIGVGNQAGATPRKERSGSGARPFTGSAKGFGAALESPTPSLAAIQPGFAVSPADLNLYAYCVNNPLTSTDPDGRWSWKGFAQGAWDLATEPFKQVADVATVVGAAYHNATSNEAHIYAEDLQLSSMIGQAQLQRIKEGQGGLEATAKGLGEMAATVVTGGAYALERGISANVEAFSRGEITQEQLDYNLSRLAGSLTAGAIGGAALSKTSGAGWTGRAANEPVTLGNITPDKPISPTRYAELREETPTSQLRKSVNPVGPKADPVYGYEVTRLEADHIVSLKEVTQMPGFNRLTFEGQVEVINLRENIMGLGKSSNASKGARSWVEWKGHSRLGPVPAAVREQMLEAEAAARAALERAIQERLKR
jgi:hypothetical protein